MTHLKSRKHRYLLIFLMPVLCVATACTPNPVLQDGPPGMETGEIDGVRFYLSGNAPDVTPATEFGICLMGGGSDEPNALKWMIERSGGGDFVVIRASGGSGYNPYIHDELGGVDSVLTLIIDSRAKADTAAVNEKVRQAEALFIAGGDQTAYDNFWNGSHLEDTIHHLMNVKKIPVGGTSAGMAILSGVAYLPQHLGVYASEALNDPYHENMEALRTDFLVVPFMAHTVTDTHFSERDRDRNPPGRLGRTIAFLARIVSDGISVHTLARAIACDERTAVCFDETGTARVFGFSPQRDDNAFFFSCNSRPDRCESGSPLDWKNAVRVYRIPGTQEGEFTFNLANWSSDGGSWHQVNVDNGSLTNDIQTPN